MSASASPAGQEFAAANADINFITAADLEATAKRRLRSVPGKGQVSTAR